MNIQIRSAILKDAATAEPYRDALVKKLVEFDNFRYPEVLDALDGLLAEGAVKNVGGQIVIPEGDVPPQPATLPAPPAAATTPTPKSDAVSSNFAPIFIYVTDKRKTEYEGGEGYCEIRVWIGTTDLSAIIGTKLTSCGAWVTVDGFTYQQAKIGRRLSAWSHV